MFTGLVDDVGTIERVTPTDAGLEVRVRCRYDDLQVGESIALNGACLTVREQGRGYFTCAAVIATLAVTTIGQWRVGQRVNLERALRVNDRLGGHFVLGHVDGVGRVEQVTPTGDMLTIDLVVPAALSELMVEKGSIAVDGVSLTIQALPAPNTVQVTIIEHTASHTILDGLMIGDAVHIEADVIAKHVRRLLSDRLSS